MYIWIFLYKYSFVIYRYDAGWDLRVITGLQKPGSREISERQDDSDGSHSTFPVLWRQKILRVRRQAYLLHSKLPWCSTCTSIIMKTVYDKPQGRIRSHLYVVKRIFVCVSGVSSALWTLFKTLCLLEWRPWMNRQSLKVLFLKINNYIIYFDYLCQFLPDM